MLGLLTFLEDAVKTPWFWLAIGYGGQAIFGARFLVQWIASERAKRIVVPAVFWHLSIFGSVLVLAYAIYRLDPVFIVANSVNTLLYARNLYVHERSRTATALR